MLINAIDSKNRIISIQMAPQIRIIQKNSFSMRQKIQSIIVNSIQFWRSQLVISLVSENSLKAAKAEKQVSDLTSQLLKCTSYVICSNCTGIRKRYC